MKQVHQTISEKLTEDLAAAIGREKIIESSDYIRNAEQTTYRTSESILLVLVPETVSDLQHCIRIAQKYKQPVFTVSQGKNWGYGSRVPVTGSSILIELKKLNRILDFDEKLAYITIEPGVTFNDAFSFLRKNNSELIVSVIGGSGDASIIGNALERGIGTGLYADRFSFICGIEVLLPDGNLIATGFERYGDYKTGKLFRWGNGPSLDGLFSQSNLGIVTKMTVWLMKTPPLMSILFYKINNAANIPKLIDELQAMIMDGLVRPTVTIYNDVRVVSTIMQYPFAQTNDTIIDADVLMKQIKASVPMIGNTVGEWNGEISIRSVSAEHADMQIKLVKEKLLSLADDVQVVQTSKEEVLHTFQQHYNPAVYAAPPSTMQAFLLKKYIGIPDNSAVKQAYWRKRRPVPADINPDRDKCGLIWISPIVPFQGADVAEAIRLIKATIKKYLFEPAISLQCTSERCIHIIASFGWDREIENEDDMAERCYFELENQLYSKGYFSYRTATLQTNRYENKKNKAYRDFLSYLKKTLDPHTILSPGKYI